MQMAKMPTTENPSINRAIDRQGEPDTIEGTKLPAISARIHTQPRNRSRLTASHHSNQTDKPALSSMNLNQTSSHRRLSSSPAEG